MPEPFVIETFTSWVEAPAFTRMLRLDEPLIEPASESEASSSWWLATVTVTWALSVLPAASVAL